MGHPVEMEKERGFRTEGRANELETFLFGPRSEGRGNGRRRRRRRFLVLIA